MNTNQFNQAMNTDIQAFIQNFAPAILGILIIFWVISRQLRARVVTARMTIYLILMAFGAIEIFQYVEKSGQSSDLQSGFATYLWLVEGLDLYLLGQ